VAQTRQHIDSGVHLRCVLVGVFSLLSFEDNIKMDLTKIRSELVD
jgi:hypothetical protein